MRRYGDELDRDMKWHRKRPQEYLKYIIAVVILLTAVLLLVKLLRPEKEEAVLGTETHTQTENQISDLPQSDAGLAGDTVNGTEEGTDTEISDTKGPIELLTAGTVAETMEQTRGVDVAKYQGIIDWEAVASDGIDFAMIRIGSRSMGQGEIREDEMAKYNLQEASKYGIKLGVYFFSTAITEEEAIEEADWVAEFIAKYPITYPVAYDCEGYENEKNRHSVLTKEERTSLAIIFMDRIYEQGYTPMFYAAKNELTDELKWETSRLEKRYRIWVSQYADLEKTDYVGAYAMWQHTNQGSVAGIDGDVDLNIAYFGYSGTESSRSSVLPEHVTVNEADLMNFEDVEEVVTAKNKTNLRDIPSQAEESTVVMQLVNGDTAIRTGISNTGWSRVEYNGAVYYAVSSYLTTDLDAPAQQDKPIDDDGIKTEFTACNDAVTAKIEVNLRTLPSVTNEDSQVVATLYNGEYITRTGINQEYGWSRVEYNGQTLYCVSSYLQTAE